MVNNSTNINKTNNNHSPQLTKHKKKNTTYDVGNPGKQGEIMQSVIMKKYELSLPLKYAEALVNLFS